MPSRGPAGGSPSTLHSSTCRISRRPYPAVLVGADLLDRREHHDEDEDELEEKDELQELKRRLREAEAHLWLARLGLKNLTAENKELKSLVGRRGKKRKKSPPKPSYQWDVDKRDKLIKVLGMLGSSHDGERANAAQQAERIRKEAGIAWGDIL
jgi:hypothetical protein